MDRGLVAHAEMRKTFLLLGLAVAVLLGAYAYSLFAPRHTPPGQPPLVQLSSGELSPVIAAFNEAADRTRLLVLLSPT
jgi:hypothetical protein